MVEQFFANRLIVVTLVAVLALLLIAWIAARVQTARRSRGLAAALGDSTRGLVLLRRGPGAGGLAGVIEPPPDPYVSLTVDYRAASGLNPLTWLGRLARVSDPAGVALVGALFALSFDTVSQAALFAVAGVQAGG